MLRYLFSGIGAIVYDCSMTCEGILKYMGKIGPFLTKAKRIKVLFIKRTIYLVIAFVKNHSMLVLWNGTARRTILLNAKVWGKWSDSILMVIYSGCAEVAPCIGQSVSHARWLTTLTHTTPLIHHLTVTHSHSLSQHYLIHTLTHTHTTRTFYNSVCKPVYRLDNHQLFWEVWWWFYISVTS